MQLAFSLFDVPYCGVGTFDALEGLINSRLSIRLCTLRESRVFTKAQLSVLSKVEYL